MGTFLTPTILDIIIVNPIFSKFFSFHEFCEQLNNDKILARELVIRTTCHVA